MTANACTCTTELYCPEFDLDVCRRTASPLARSVRALRHWFADWHTGSRGADLIESLNDAQRKDVGMERDHSRRSMDRLERERYLWHRPLL